MTEETKNLLGDDFNIPWDSETDQVDENGPLTITDYGSMQLIAVKKVQMFAKDSKVTIPGFSIDGKPYERGGMKEGHAPGGKNATAYFIAFFGKAFTDDKDFTTVRIFTTLTNIPVDVDKIDTYPVIALTDKQKQGIVPSLSGPDFEKKVKTIWLSDWSNLQFPALRQLPKDAQEKFQKGYRIFFKADNWNTGAKPNEDREGKTDKDGNVKKYYQHYWYNFTVFANEEEMLKARREARGTASNGSSVDESNFPLTWKGQDGALLYKMICDGLAAGKTPLAVAQEVSCLQQPGNKPGVRLDGETPLDLPKLFEKATGKAAGMFTF